MTTIVYLLSIIGLMAICLGAAGAASKWLDSIERRNRETREHRSAVIESLKRIEAAAAKSNKPAL